MIKVQSISKKFRCLASFLLDFDQRLGVQHFNVVSKQNKNGSFSYNLTVPPTSHPSCVTSFRYIHLCAEPWGFWKRGWGALGLPLVYI